MNDLSVMIIIHIIARISNTTNVPTVPIGDIILHRSPPNSPPPIFSSAHISKNSPIEVSLIGGLSVILITNAERTITRAYTAADLTFATASMSLLETINISVAASIIGNRYSMIPISPNMNHLIHAPTLPARLKLLKRSIKEQASAIRITISSLRGLDTTPFFDVLFVLFLAEEVFLAPVLLPVPDFEAEALAVVLLLLRPLPVLDLLLLALVEFPLPAKTNSSISLRQKIFHQIKINGLILVI